MTHSPVRIGVVGAGVMGANHARIVRQVPSAHLSGVFDVDRERAEVLANGYATVASHSLEHLAGQIDAAIIATPTDAHESAACELIEAGIHVLVEKPLAPDSAAGQRIVAAAAANDRILRVGHVERFNPAAMELPGLVDRPIHFASRRIGSYSGRIRDGVVLDLMLHDLDLVSSLVRSPVVDVQATTTTVRSNSEDIAMAIVTFANGVTASFEANRLGQEKVRTLTVTQPDNTIEVDLLRQQLTLHRVTSAEFLSEHGVRYRESGMVEVPFLENRGEPLALQTQAFVDAVNGDATRSVPGEDGVEAVRLAAAISTAAGAR